MRRRILPSRSSTTLQTMKAFIDARRYLHGVEPICKALPIAPSTHYALSVNQAEPALRSKRATTDEALVPEVERVRSGSFEVCGVCMVGRQLQREQLAIARCTVQRSMGAGNGMPCAALGGANLNRSSNRRVPARLWQTRVPRWPRRPQACSPLV